jgi:hypothetical protein
MNVEIRDPDGFEPDGAPYWKAGIVTRVFCSRRKPLLCRDSSSSHGHGNRREVLVHPLVPQPFCSERETYDGYHRLTS